MQVSRIGSDLSFTPIQADAALPANSPSRLHDEIKQEAEYILAAQVMDSSSVAYGAINNIYGAPTWVVPRENALAILNLLQVADFLDDRSYIKRAKLAADYLVRVQDNDGGWFDKYSYQTPALFSKSPTQTAEVMMAFGQLGYCPKRYEAMKKGAEFLLSLQQVQNKKGVADGLISGGKNSDGSFMTWRWASDNSFAYWALQVAAAWAACDADSALQERYKSGAEQILQGIDTCLFVSDTTDRDFGVWRRVIDEYGKPIDPNFHEWINYAPQMLNLPAKGVGRERVGVWIHQTLQKEDGAVVWDDAGYKHRKSPGFSFQAALAWQSLGLSEYADAAITWARQSGLWQQTNDANQTIGGWVDWSENSSPAPFWERFIDTSFYATAAFLGGYDFRVPKD